jgi:hypothetical protein
VEAAPLSFRLYVLHFPASCSLVCCCWVGDHQRCTNSTTRILQEAFVIYCFLFPFFLTILIVHEVASRYEVYHDKHTEVARQIRFGPKHTFQLVLLSVTSKQKLTSLNSESLIIYVILVCVSLAIWVRLQMPTTQL